MDNTKVFNKGKILPFLGLPYDFHYDLNVALTTVVNAALTAIWQ